LQVIKCTNPACDGKILLEAQGEVKKKCPKCKEYTHVVTTSKGIIDLSASSKPTP